MKIFLKSFILLLVLVACDSSEKEKTKRELERSEKKLDDYRQDVSTLNRDLAELQQQFEVAEDNIIINLVKEFRIYRTKKERAKRIENAVAAKEDLEDSIEQTILKINTLSDSLKTTENKIRTAKAALQN